MSPESASLAQLYEAFNAHDIDAAPGVMHPDVIWPNGWEGGYVVGHEAVRDYWTRQWAEIIRQQLQRNSRRSRTARSECWFTYAPSTVTERLFRENMATHTYAFDSGRIRSMEIGEPG
jgi:hypothetical protein